MEASLNVAGTSSSNNENENESEETMLLCEAVNPASLPSFILRKQIQLVHKSTRLSATDKNQRIQDLMKGKLRQCLSDCCGGKGRVIDYVDESKISNDGAPTQAERRARLTKQTDQKWNWCVHYSKHCSRFYFACCGVIDPCHRCHWERGTLSCTIAFLFVCLFPSVDPIFYFSRLLFSLCSFFG